MPTKELPVRKEKEEAPKKTKASAKSKPFIVKPYEPPAIVRKYPHLGWPRFLTPEELAAKMQQVHPIKFFEECGYIGINAQEEVEYLDDNGHAQSVSVDSDEIGRAFGRDDCGEKHTYSTEKSLVNAAVLDTYIRYASKAEEITVLDDHNLGTSMRLIRMANVNRHKITVYNYQKNFEELITIRKNERPNIVIRDVLLSLLDRENVPEHLLLDFCATLKNTLWVVSLALKRGLLVRENGLLWFTVSTRCYSLADVQAILREFVEQAYVIYDYKLNLVLEVEYRQIKSVIFVTGNAHAQTDFSLQQARYEAGVSGAAASVGRPPVTCIPIPVDYSSEEDYSSEDDDYLPESESETEDNDSAEDEDVDDLPASALESADTEMETDTAQSDDGEAYYKEEAAATQPQAAPSYFRLDDEKGYVRFRFPAVSNMAKPLYVYSPDFLAAPYSRPFQGQVSAKKFEAWSLLKQTQYVEDNLRWLEG